MEFGDFENYANVLLTKIEKKIDKQKFIRGMSEKKPEMVKKKLKRDFSAVIRTDREIIDFIEFMADFVREIGKEQRGRNIGDIVELSIRSLTLYEDCITITKTKNIEKTTYLRKLLKSKGAEDYISKQREEMEKSEEKKEDEFDDDEIEEDEIEEGEEDETEEDN
jgi:hypothetical protein